MCGANLAPLSLVLLDLVPSNLCWNSSRAILDALWTDCGTDTPTVPIETKDSTEKGTILMDNWMQNNRDLLSGRTIRTNSDRYVFKILKRHIFEIWPNFKDWGSTRMPSSSQEGTIAVKPLCTSTMTSVDNEQVRNEAVHQEGTQSNNSWRTTVGDDADMDQSQC